MGFWDHYDEMGPLPSRGAERGHLFRELFERGSSRDFEYYGVSKNPASGNYKGWSQHMAEGRASSYVNTSSNYWAKPYYPPPRASLGGTSIGSQSMANSFRSMNVEGQLGLPGFNTNTNQFGSVPRAPLMPYAPASQPIAPSGFTSRFNPGAYRTLGQGIGVATMLGAQFFGSKDDVDVSYPLAGSFGALGAYIGTNGIQWGRGQAEKAFARAGILESSFVSKGGELLADGSKVPHPNMLIRNGAVTQYKGLSPLGALNVGYGVAELSRLKDGRQSTTNSVVANLGGMAIGGQAINAATWLAAGSVTTGAAAMLGFGAIAAIGIAASYYGTQAISNSLNSISESSGIAALERNTNKLGMNAAGALARDYPARLSQADKIALPAAALIDSVAQIPVLVNAPFALAEAFGGSIKSLEGEYSSLRGEAKTLSGRFANQTPGEASANLYRLASSTTGAGPMASLLARYGGGKEGQARIIEDAFSTHEAVANLSTTANFDARQKAAYGTFETLSNSVQMGRAALDNIATKQSRLREVNDTHSFSRGLVNQARAFNRTAVGPRAGSFDTGRNAFADGTRLWLANTFGAVGDFFNNIPKAIARPGIERGIAQDKKVLERAALNITRVSNTSSPQELAYGAALSKYVSSSGRAGVRMPSLPSASGRGGGYDNSWQIKAEARYQQAQREQAVKERSYQAQADNRLALARIPDVIAPHVNSWDMKRGVSHPGASGGLAQSLMELRANSELGSQELSTYISELGVKKAATEKQQAAVMANPALNKQGKTEELTRTTEELSRLNAQIAIATKNQTQHNRVLEISTKEYKDQAAFLTKQNAENLNRTNYQQNRDIFNQRSATLLNKKTNGLISGRNFLAQSFDLNKGFLESQIKEMNDGLASDLAEFKISKDNFGIGPDGKPNGQAYDPNGTYAPGTEGYDLQQTERALQTRRSNIGIYENELKTTFSASARRFQDRRSLSAAIEKGISPYTSQFFGSLGRGNSFGDSIKALQLPFMQQIGQLASRGISSGLAGLFQDFTLKSAAGGSPSGQAFDITSELLPATDGDSLKLKDGTQIRIAGIDAPEKNQAGGLEAAVGLQAILKKAKSVAFQQTGLSYGRSVGTVTVDGKDLGKMMASSGLAQPGFGKYGEFASKFRFSDPKLHRMANQAAGVLAGGESFPDGLVDNFTAAATADASSIPYFGQIYSGNSIQSYFQKNSELVGLPVIGGSVGGGAASPIGNFQSFANAPVRGGGAGSAVGSLGSTGVLAGIGAAFKSTGGITGMVSRFFGKSGTTSIASTLAAKGGTIGKLAGNFAKNGGMGFGSLAAFGNLLGGAVGSIGGAYVGKMIASEHYGNTGGTVGSTVGGIAGSIIGTALGGPVGAVIGGFLGSLLGGGIGGFFGGGSGKKAAKEQQAAQELHQKTMSVFVPKIKGIMGDIDPLDWDSVEGAKNRLRATPVRGREQTSIRRAAYNDIAAIKKALLPYKDLSDRPGGIAGNLFENRVRGEIAQNAYGAFSSAPTRELYGLYSQIQSQLSELKPEVRGTYKTLSQEALTSQYNYQNQALNLQISRGNTNYGFDVRGAEIASRDRAIGYDQAQHNLGNFDRDTQRSLEQVMGVTQRRGNRNAIAAELLSERAFQKGIAERSFGVLGDSNALQDEKSTFNLSTALQDLGFLTESQRNLTTEYNKLLPVIGDINDELLRLLSSIKDVNDALKKL